MIAASTTQSPNFPEVLTKWLGKKEAENILAQNSLILPYWFDVGILERISKEVAEMDEQDITKINRKKI